jgi:AraC-like DNA-binding protein
MAQEGARVVSAASPTFRWGDLDDFVGAIATADDATEVLRDTPGSQFVRVAIAPDRGTGVLEYLCEESLRVLVMDGRLHDGLSVFVVDDGWIRLNFSLRIAINMAIGGRVEVQEHDPSWRLFRLPPGAGSEEVVDPGAEFRWLTLCCRPEYLAAVAGIELDNIPFLNEGIAEDGGPELIYRYYGFTHRIHSATSDVFDYRCSDVLRGAQLTAKANELIVLAVDYLLHDRGVAALVGLRLTERDLKTIDAVRDLLDTRIADPINVDRLARQMGINRNKLFYGFKQRFGMTMSDYVSDRRLREGMRLLVETDEPLAAIAAGIGFRHQCNFSTSFKRQYGLSPSAVRRGRT